MEIAEVVDRENLEAYLDDLPVPLGAQISAWFTHRLAVKAAPLGIYVLASDQQTELSCLPIFGALACAFIKKIENLVPIDKPVLRDLSTISHTCATECYVFIGHEAGGHSCSTVADALDATIVDTDDDRLNSYRASETFDTILASTGSEKAEVQDLQEELRFALQQDANVSMNSAFPLKQSPEFSRIWLSAKTWLENKPYEKWQFWIAWYERILAGKNTHPDLMVPILNKLTKEDWLGDPAAVNVLFEDMLAVCEAEDAAAGELTDGAAPSHQLKTVRAQVSTLHDFLDAEYHKLSGHNARTPVQDELLEIITDLLALVVQMSERFDAVSDGAQALVVTQENLPAIIAKTGELAMVEPVPTISPTVATMTATIQSLTDAGGDAKVATFYALSEAAYNKLWPNFQRLFGRKPS